MKKITMTTRDGLTIAGDYVERKGTRYAGILIHMMPADRRSFSAFSQKLKDAEFNSFAIDLAGHGESQGGPQGYKAFSDEAHQRSLHDVAAASDFLASQGFDLSHQFIVGASIGANLALWFLAEHPELAAVVLLSPGLDYRGIKTEPLAQKVEGRKVFLAASRDDFQSYEAVMTLEKTVQGSKALTYHEAGHGTSMFGKEVPDLETEIINWLKEMLHS